MRNKKQYKKDHFMRFYVGAATSRPPRSEYNLCG